MWNGSQQLKGTITDLKWMFNQTREWTTFTKCITHYHTHSWVNRSATGGHIHSNKIRKNAKWTLKKEKLAQLWTKTFRTLTIPKIIRKSAIPSKIQCKQITSAKNIVWFSFGFEDCSLKEANVFKWYSNNSLQQVSSMYDY